MRRDHSHLGSTSRIDADTYMKMGVEDDVRFGNKANEAGDSLHAVRHVETKLR